MAPHQVILGGGLTGLIITTHLALDHMRDNSHGRVTLLAKPPLGTVIDGPMYLHVSEESTDMLDTLGFDTAKMQTEITVGHMTQSDDGSWEQSDPFEFRDLYYRHSRSTTGKNPTPPNIMNGDQHTFMAWDIDWRQVTDRMLAIIRQAQNTTIILDEMQHIDSEGVFTHSGSFIPYDNMISTIPRLVLEKAYIDGDEYERRQIPDINKSTKVLYRVHTEDMTVINTFRDDFTYTLPVRGGAYDRLTRVTRIPGYNNQFILEYTLPFVSDYMDIGFKQFLLDRSKWHEQHRCHELNRVIHTVPRNDHSAMIGLGNITYQGRYAQWDDQVKLTDILKVYPINED